MIKQKNLVTKLALSVLLSKTRKKRKE